MRLITTHVGADFDALASMVAARRLFPDGRLFFPGSKEESVRRLLESGYYDTDELRQRQVDPDAIAAVVLCDVRQAGRLGAVAEWLASRPGVERTAYDHHPDAEDDVAVGGGVVDPAVGATSTLMVEEMLSREIRPEPREATLLLAGIYEDTGSLTYASTSARDLRAAGQLFEWGADLEVVRRWAVQRLDVEHLEVLHGLLARLEVHRAGSRRLGVTALELGDFVEEVAPLVSRMVELTGLPAVLALVGEGERVSVIARGELPGVDLGSLLAQFAGGGGHPTAAAGSLRGVTALEARERLLERLPELLPPGPTAGQLMARPFVSVPAEATVEEARTVLARSRINAAPVQGEDDRISGIVTRQLIDAAMEHGMEARPVVTIQATDPLWTEAATPVDELLEPIRRGVRRLILVGDRTSGRVDGVLSRGTILRQLAGSAADQRIAAAATASRPVAPDPEALLARLPADLAPPVEEARRVAAQWQTPVSLVGGLVRDLVLGRRNRDLDLVVEGDGPELARELARRLGGRARVHEAFMTAVVLLPGEQRIDVATARSEIYPGPAELPEVESGPLRRDLYRRDFTVNALALRIGPGSPELLDYFGGLADVEARNLRVLHSLSFIDDPTRALRAVRLESRLGFRITPETERLIGVALEEGVFDRLSGSRLREELRRLLDDPETAIGAVERLEELGLTRALHPELRLDEPARNRLHAALRALDWRRLEGWTRPGVEKWRLFLRALVEGLPATALPGLRRRLQLAQDDAAAILDKRRPLEETLRALAAERLAPHRVAELLEGGGEEERLLLFGLASGPARRRLRRYLTRDRRLELGVGGDDLIARGARPGPELGAALRQTWRARVDGTIDAAQELEHALERWREMVGSPAGAAGVER